MRHQKLLIFKPFARDNDKTTNKLLIREVTISSWREKAW